LEAVRELPSGTVTFLFTDIEGSTKLLHKLGPERYAQELSEQRRVLREAFARHGGVEVDTQGDAFFVAFPTAPGALTAAREAQTALEIPVRMGLHTGTPLLADEGYIGADVHRAARIAASGHGRQVLVSASTAALLDPHETVLLDLGEHRLKDLSAPERIYQAGEAEFPPLKTLYQTNLPVQATPLVGRERELGEVIDLVRSQRLVTLVGAGGSGKTRLAMQAAAELVEEFSDGVWFVSLASLTDPQLLVPTVAQAVGAREDLDDHLRGKELLLLLDNLEQLLPEAAETVAALDTQALITSREPLRIAAEYEYEVPTLPLEDASLLFTERARQIRRSFKPDEHVTEIVRRLDGLPLAIELAAARTKLLRPKQILERLPQALDLLRGGARDAPERQRTLRDTIEWSFDLLEPRERRLFAQLAVFAGSFEIEAAESVCGADVDDLQSLVEKSLLRQTETGRLFMLETIRDYALEQLGALAGVDEVRRRHAMWFLSFAEEAEERLRGPEEAIWLDRLERELDNFRGALAWFDEAGIVDAVQRLAAALWHLWSEHGHLVEGREWLARALARPGADLGARAKALQVSATLAMEAGTTATVGPFADESARLYERLGDELGAARARTIRAWAHQAAGELDEARRLHQQAVASTRRAGDSWRLQVALNNLGNFSLDQEDFADAAQVLEEALELSRMIGFPDSKARVLINLGFARLGLVDPDRAESCFLEALTLASRTGSITSTCDAFIGLAAIAAARAEQERCARLMGAADAVLEEVGRRLDGWEQRVREVTLAAVHRDLAERAAALFAEGHALTRDAAIAYALGQPRVSA
jgi:predicted ATPase